MTFVQAPRPRFIVAIDVSALTHPDPVILDALVRLQLAVGRLGASIQLRNASAELVDLLALVGLADVIPVAMESGFEADG